MTAQEQAVHAPDRWRLLDERGRQTWHYLDSEQQAKEWPQSLVDRHHLGLELVGKIHFTQTPINPMLHRIYHDCHPRTPHSMPLPTPYHSSLNFNYRRVIGPASMADPCFFYQV